MNQLYYRTEFVNVLQDYQVSDSVLAVLRRLRLVLLSGPSASGRNTIINSLLKSGDYEYIVSDTTRQPRVNDGVPETDGIEYWFRSEEQFLQDLKQGNYLEAEIIHNQQVSGISLKELNRVSLTGNIAIDEVEIGGFMNILSLKPDTVGIFILPPSFNIWMDRMQRRNQMPETEIISRLQTGLRIFYQALHMQNTFAVVNDQLEEAVMAVDRLARGHMPKITRANQQLLENLQRDTLTFLGNHDVSSTLDA